MIGATRTTRVRLELIALLLVCIGPLVLAFVLYYTLPDPGPRGRTNAGVLLDPVRRIPERVWPAPGIFRKQWTLLLVAPEGCGHACRDRLEQTRKIRALLHDDSRRVQRVLVTGDRADRALVRHGHPGLRVFRGDGDLHRYFGQVGPAATGPAVIYLIDPLGNWVLYYPPSIGGKAVFKDLEHLLDLSRIG